MTHDVDSEPVQLFELYQENPEEADRLIFGRESYPDRRGFFRKAGLATMGAMIGTGIALLLSELGLEVEMSVGFVIGLAIGAYLDKRKKDKRV